MNYELIGMMNEKLAAVEFNDEIDRRETIKEVMLAVMENPPVYSLLFPDDYPQPLLPKLPPLWRKAGN